MRVMDPGSESLRLAIRCDGLRDRGVGHLVRQMALMEELRDRGHHVWLVGDIDVDWVREQAGRLANEASPAMPDERFIAASLDRGVTAVMIDGYPFDARLGAGLQGAGIGVLTMVDDTFGRHQMADIYIDQNLGARPGDSDALWLTGPEYVLVRDVVRERRGRYAPGATGKPRVLVVFGGTDPFGGTPLAVQLLLETGRPVHIVAVAADAGISDQLSRLAVSAEQELEVLPPQQDLPGLALSCDFAVIAAGSTVWELACLGVPTGLVCVVDNQLEGYRQATRELAMGLGPLTELREDRGTRASAIRSLTRLLGEPGLREHYSTLASSLVDGDGRVRVADAIERLAR